MESLTVRKRWQLLAVFAAFIFLIVGLAYLPRRGIPSQVDSRGATIPNDPQWATVPVVLHGIPSIERTSGHPHSPLGVHGKNEYLYDDSVQIDGFTYRLFTRNFEPIAGIKSETSVLLLTQGFFQHNLQQFQFYLADKKGSFQSLDVSNLPQELWKLSFLDHNQTCSFRVWMLQELARRDSLESALRCFNQFVNSDPRFGMLDPWQGMPDHMPAASIGEFVRDVILSSRDPRFSLPLEKVVASFQSTDSPSSMRLVLMCLLRIDREAGIRAICSLKSSIPNPADLSDMRAYMVSVDTEIQSIECEPRSKTGEEKVSGWNAIKLSCFPS